MIDKKVTDLTYLKGISLEDDNMVIEMIEVFLGEYRDALSEMHGLHERGEWGELRASAHKFKPNLAYMGIALGMETIEEVEEHAKNNNAGLKIDSKLNKLQNICEQASKELRQEIENMNIP